MQQFFEYCGCVINFVNASHSWQCFIVLFIHSTTSASITSPSAADTCNCLHIAHVPCGILLISVPSLVVYYCQQLTLFVCLSVWHKKTLNFFFFVSRWNRTIFWPSVLHDPLYKTFFDFWFRPPNAQNLLPKICTKSPISWLVWQIDRRCLGLPGGFRGWPIQWNHAKCCGADPCWHGNEIWSRHGDPFAYRLVFDSLQWFGVVN